MNTCMYVVRSDKITVSSLSPRSFFLVFTVKIKDKKEKTKQIKISNRKVTAFFFFLYSAEILKIFIVLKCSSYWHVCLL